MFAGLCVDGVDDIRRERYIDDNVQSTFEAVDQVGDLARKTPNTRGFFRISERGFLYDHRTVCADKLIYDPTLRQSFPPQEADRRGKSANIGHGIAVGKLALYVR